MAKKRPKSISKFDKDFEKSERLFHYTSSEGLYGILSSGCLWATHFRFLNDSNEFFAARKSLKEFIERKIRPKIVKAVLVSRNSPPDGMTAEEISENESRVIVDSMYGATLNIADPFIFSSFVSRPSEKSFRTGELLHWATYGKDGGYALEIDPHKLAAILPDESVLSLRAVYVKRGAPKQLSKEYAQIASVASDMIDGILKNDLQSVDTGKSAGPFMKAASIIKDEYFKAEKEARVVYMRFKSDPSEERPAAPVFIRHKGGRSIPYIKLFDGKLIGKGSPIRAIIIGPHPDRERRKDALSIFLESNGLGHVKIIQSEVPYIGG